MRLYGNWIYMISTYAISSYHHWSCEFESRPYEEYSIQHYVCQRLPAGRWFSPVSSINKIDRHEITAILLKLLSMLNTITLTLHKKNQKFHTHLAHQVWQSLIFIYFFMHQPLWYCFLFQYFTHHSRRSLGFIRI
jgi:hypothetical protein